MTLAAVGTRSRQIYRDSRGKPSTIPARAAALSWILRPRPGKNDALRFYDVESHVCGGSTIGSYHNRAQLRGLCGSAVILLPSMGSVSTITEVPVQRPLREPPMPPGGWLLGNLPSFAGDILGYHERCAREYGEIVRLRLADRITYMVN